MCVTTFQRQITHHTSRPNKWKRKERNKTKRNVHSILIWMLRSYGYIRFYFFLQRQKHIYLIFSVEVNVNSRLMRWEFRYFHIKMSFRWATVRAHTFYQKLFAAICCFFIDFDRNFVFFHITIKHESYLNGNQYWNFGKEKKKRDI